MSHFTRFIEQIQTLYALVMLQKVARLFLRAFWLALAGVLAGWSLDALWGWLPNPVTWFFLGFGFALFPLVTIFITLFSIAADFSPPAAWIESLDRRLRQRQQLSTAWEVAQKREAAGPLANLLVDDVMALFPHARAPILKGGWYRKSDLAAAGLLTMLSCGLLAALLIQQPAPAQAGPAPTQLVPIIVPDVTNTAPQPTNSPGDQNPGQSEPAPNSNPGAAPGDSSAGSSDSQDGAAVADALRQLGSELDGQAGTRDLGQALQNLEMNRAADALEDLSSQMDEVSPETRENLSDALEDAASSLEQAIAPQLSQSLQDASNALDDPRASQEQPMDQLADDLRQLESQMQAFQDGSSTAGQGDSGGTAAGGQAEPASRLLNENGQLEIPQENAAPSGLLSPARPDAGGEGTASGSLDASQTQQLPSGQSPLLPSSFLWKWRDVVSQYFQR